MGNLASVFKSSIGYEVFLEEIRHFPNLDASACYTFIQLLRIGDELLAMDERILSSLGIRHGRLKLLMVLRKSKHQVTPANLAEKTGVTRATISGLLDGLQKEGFIERQPDAKDRRVIQVKLTQTGKELLDKIRPVYSQWFTGLIKPLTELERQQLVNLLQKIHRHLAEVSVNESALPDQAA